MALQLSQRFRGLDVPECYVRISSLTCERGSNRAVVALQFFANEAERRAGRSPLWEGAAEIANKPEVSHVERTEVEIDAPALDDPAPDKPKKPKKIVEKKVVDVPASADYDDFLDLGDKGANAIKAAYLALKVRAEFAGSKDM